MRALLLSVILLAGCGRSAEAWTEEGDALLRADDLVGAERAYNRAVARDSHHVPAIYGLGWSYYASGHDQLRPTADQLFQRAIDYDPEYYGGYRGRGVLAFEDGDSVGAERMLRKAWECAPNNPGVLVSLGHLYLAGARLAEAEQVFRAAVAADPQRGELHRFVADVLMEAGEWAEAREELELGLAAPVSGVRRLWVLQEGLVVLELRFARSRLDVARSAEDPALASALQSLARADTVLQDTRALGVADAVVTQHQRTLDALQDEAERIRAVLSATGGDPGEP